MIDLKRARIEIKELKKRESRIYTPSPGEIEKYSRRPPTGLFLALTVSLVISLVSATIAVPTFTGALKQLETEREIRRASDEKIASLEHKAADVDSQIADLRQQLADSQSREQRLRQELELEQSRNQQRTETGQPAPVLPPSVQQPSTSSAPQTPLSTDPESVSQSIVRFNELFLNYLSARSRGVFQFTTPILSQELNVGSSFADLTKRFADLEINFRQFRYVGSRPSFRGRRFGPEPEYNYYFLSGNAYSTVLELLTLVGEESSGWKVNGIWFFLISPNPEFPRSFGSGQF